MRQIPFKPIIIFLLIGAFPGQAHMGVDAAAAVVRWLVDLLSQNNTQLDQQTVQTVITVILIIVAVSAGATAIGNISRKGRRRA